MNSVETDASRPQISPVILDWSRWRHTRWKEFQNWPDKSPLQNLPCDKQKIGKKRLRVKYKSHPSGNETRFLNSGHLVGNAERGPKSLPHLLANPSTTRTAQWAKGVSFSSETHTVTLKIGLTDSIGWERVTWASFQEDTHLIPGQFFSLTKF